MEYSMDYTRPAVLEVRGARVTTRNAWALWILTFITLGIWGIVWWYQVNRELRDVGSAVDDPLRVPPAISTVLMALWPLALVPALVSILITGHRARSVQGTLEIGERRINAALAALLFFLVFSHVWYIQRSLNRTWLHGVDG
ncbi:MAG: DUF4234 domain-containing protein [Gaiellales bacterium]